MNKHTIFDHSIGAFFDYDDPRRAWIVAPCSQTRDSGPLDKSNFAACLAELGGESDTVEVHLFDHWGPGWFEVIICDPCHGDTVESIARALSDYPVLDEMDLSEREMEDAMESWESWARRDFIRHVCGGRDLCADVLDNADSGELFELFQEMGGEHYTDGNETYFDFNHCNDTAPLVAFIMAHRPKPLSPLEYAIKVAGDTIRKGRTCVDVAAWARNREGLEAL